MFLIKFTNLSFNKSISFLVSSGYIKEHGLKYQTTLFPNGMVAGVFGTSSNNIDLGMLNLSRLTQHLESLLFPNLVMAGGLLLTLFGDAIFLGHNYSTIITRYDLESMAEEQQMLR